MTDGSLRKRVATLRALAGTSECQLWPTCLVCTAASCSRYPPDGIWVPVGSYRYEPEWGKFHAPRELNSRGGFTIVAECHGDKQQARVEVPTWWGDAHILAAIQSLMFFGRGERKLVMHGLEA